VPYMAEDRMYRRRNFFFSALRGEGSNAPPSDAATELFTKVRRFIGKDLEF